MPHDTVAPWITDQVTFPAILVFSRTDGWRHNEGIAGADRFWVDFARANGMGIFTTVNGAVFNPEQLSRFELVVFNNMTGDALSPEQEAAFEDWLKAGGAWIGIHGAGDSSQSEWGWYQDELIGPGFISHPAAPHIQDAVVEVLAPDHPVMAGIPARFHHSDEWYTFDSRAQDHGFTALAGLDESTYSPRNTVYGVEDLRMGEGAENHPIIWTGCVGEGRTFYSAIGHFEDSYDSPVNRQILENAYNWTTGKTDPEGAHCPS